MCSRTSLIHAEDLDSRPTSTTDGTHSDYATPSAVSSCKILLVDSFFGNSRSNFFLNPSVMCVQVISLFLYFPDIERQPQLQIISANALMLVPSGPPEPPVSQSSISPLVLVDPTISAYMVKSLSLQAKCPLFVFNVCEEELERNTVHLPLSSWHE